MPASLAHVLAASVTVALCADLSLYAAAPDRQAPQGDTPAAAVPAAERWIVHFAARSFDLEGFRAAILAHRPAAEVAAIVADLEQRVQRDQAPFAAEVARLGGAVRHQWWLINGCAIAAPAGALAALRGFPGVARIDVDGVARPAMEYATNANNHNAVAVHAAGYTGSGVGIAVVDTGQDSNMAGIGRPHRLYFPGGNPANTTGPGIGGSRLIANLQVGLMAADDTNGHGTSVACIAAGQAWGAPGAFAGHAPDAAIAGFAIADAADSSASLSTITTAWQLVAANRAALGLLVANNSYSGVPDPTDATQMALDSAAYNADILIAVAAANNGAATDSSQAACNGIAVGAVTVDEHAVTSYSSRGPFYGDLTRTYPDMVACGSPARAARDCEGEAFGGFGTSFASPQVAGAAVLVRQAAPSLTALETKAVLLAATMDVAAANPTLGRNGYGVGFLRDDVAVNTALDPARHTTITYTGPVQVPITVNAGQETAVAITWHRTVFSSALWTDYNLRILDGTTVVATGASPRNLYEHVRFTPSHSGTFLAEISTPMLPLSPEHVALAVAETANLPLAATYKSYGTPCAGSAPRAGNVWQSANGSATGAQLQRDMFLLGTGEWLLRLVAPPTGLSVTGFELLTGCYDGPTVLNTSIYVGTPGIPAAPSATSTMTVRSQPGWVGTTFSSPISVPGSRAYYLGLQVSTAPRFYFTLPTGTTSVLGYFRDVCLPTWQSGGSALVGLRVLGGTATTGKEPILDTNARPVLGGTFQAQLSQALPNAAAMLITGLSSTAYGSYSLPYSLTSLGGGSCQVWAAPDAINFLPANATGDAALPVTVPNTAALRGVQFFQQYFVLDAAANSLGLAATHGCAGLVGD